MSKECGRFEPGRTQDTWTARPSVKVSPSASLRPISAALALTILVASNALGWGREGHEVVSIIAERHLTEGTRERVRQILGPAVSLAAA